VEETLTSIEAAGTEALTAMRRVVGLLRDADDGATTAPGPEELADLVRRFDGHGPAVCLRLPADDGPMPPEVTTTVYRIVQESLTNVARHAPHAKSATIDIVRDRSGISVEITDDATPSTPRHPQRGGFGLRGMRERVEALGGTFHAGPGTEAGWTVHASLPVPPGAGR
jgi:signal transduction histidine kinase